MACQTIAKVLQRSVGLYAPPITTFQLRYPLQIHAELMTHRVFSRNARSSRAVPTKRMIQEVKDAPFIPRYWGADQKGMQAGAEHDTLVEGFEQFARDTAYTKMVDRETAWLFARDMAVFHARAFADAGYHKQLSNRLLAPFLHIDVVLTTTDLSNWDALRDHHMAEPHIRDLAVDMKRAVEWWDLNGGSNSGPDFMPQGRWHLPYVGTDEVTGMGCLETARAVSVTRCAQVSYTPFHEARLTIAEEVARHDDLINARPMHASPAEHQATPDRRKPDGSWENPQLHGNLTGWIQYRKTLSGERA